MIDDNFITGIDFYYAFLSGASRVIKNCEQINRKNYFPIPDKDTGTNVSATLEGILVGHRPSKSLKKEVDNLCDLVFSHARGNSGVIISQFLQSVSFYIKKDYISLNNLVDALSKGVDGAYKSVGSPKEGTILSLLREWSNTLLNYCQREVSIKKIFKEGLIQAKKSLDKTIKKEPFYQKNRIYDAGAYALFLFLQGVQSFIFQPYKALLLRKQIRVHSLQISRNPDSSSFDKSTGKRAELPLNPLLPRYCIEFIILDIVGSLESKGVLHQFEDQLNLLGNSIVINIHKNEVKVHIHSLYPQKVRALIAQYGTIISHKIDDMLRQEQCSFMPLSKTAIVCDSIADIPLYFKDLYHIHTFFLEYQSHNSLYFDRLSMTTADMFKQLNVEKQSSFKTFSPSLKRVEEYCQFLFRFYDSVIIVPVSKSQSSTYKQFSLAQNRLNLRASQLYIMDSKLNSIAQGLLTYKLAKESVKGNSFEDLKREGDSIQGRIKIFVIINSIEYMVKSGRLSVKKGFFLKVLGLKLIVSLDKEGKGAVKGISFSERLLRRRLLRKIKVAHKKNPIEDYALCYTEFSEKAYLFGSKLVKILKKEPLYISETSQIIGMYSGPNTVGLAILEKKRKDVLN